MAGSQQPLPSSNDWMHPFNAGQMLGMLTLMVYIEKNKGISQQSIEHLKNTTVRNLEPYLNKPSEDIYLLVDSLVEEVKNL